MNFYQKIRINKMNITQENIRCVFFYFQMEFYPLLSGKKNIRTAHLALIRIF